MKNICMLLILALFVSCSKSDKKEAKDLTAEQFEAINKVCPVSNETIAKEEMILVNHENKDYAFCCDKCVTKFKADPSTYIAKLEKMSEETEEKKVEGDTPDKKEKNSDSNTKKE